MAQRFEVNSDIHFVAQNVVDPIAIEGLNYIIHAARNVMGAKNVLDYSKVTQARALLASTLEIYGKLEQDEYTENGF